MKKNFAAVLTLAGALILPGGIFAQQAQKPASTPTATDQDIQLLREDIRSEKKQLVAANMQLTDAESTKFWPVYDAYTVETTKIGDARTTLIKEYAQTYDTMTDAQAKSLVKRSGDVDQQSVALRAQWMPKFEAVLPGKKAALFYQLDRRIELLLNLQLASGIPLVKQ
jgi:hypothetical protein